MRYALALCTLVASCQAPPGPTGAATDAGITEKAVAAPSASSFAARDADAPPVDAEASPRAVDLRAPELEKPLIACAAKVIGPRLGIRGALRIHLVVDLGDGGTPETWVEDDGRPPALARPGSCFEEWGRLVASTFPGARGRHGVSVKGPFGGWVVTVDGQ